MEEVLRTRERLATEKKRIVLVKTGVNSMNKMSRTI